MADAPPLIPQTEQHEFRLELLGLLSRTLSKSLRTVIPSLVEYLEEEKHCPDEETTAAGATAGERRDPGQIAAPEAPADEPVHDSPRGLQGD